MPCDNSSRLFLISWVLALSYVINPSFAEAQQSSSHKVISPFKVVQRNITQAGAVILSFDPAATYAQFKTACDAKKTIRLNLPLTNTNVALELREFSIRPPGARTQFVHHDGSVSYIQSPILTLTGSIAEQPGSYAFMALSPTGTLNGYFVDSGGANYIVSSGDPQKAVKGNVTVASASSLLSQSDNPWTCEVLNGFADHFPKSERQAASSSGTGTQVRIADIFLECDHRYRALFDSAEEAADYAVTLFAAVCDIFRRDLGAELRIPDGYLRIWEDVPPWGCCPFPDFFVYWRSDDNPLRDINRAAVHLLYPSNSGFTSGYSLCSQLTAYAVSGVSGYFPTPLQHTHPDNWDPLVVAHELGHNFGSIHAQSYHPPIECVDGSGPDNGTIMSYCHQEPGGVNNVGMRFHARVQEVIREYIATVACLEVIDIMLGDYDYNGVVDELDLQAARMCIDLAMGTSLGVGFESAGCLETFDLDEDGQLNSCDYSILVLLVDPDYLFKDCNENGISDECDLDEGTSEDCNGNGNPDECEDCNNNGIADECDIAEGTSKDCNRNHIPDSCDIAEGTSEDCNGNGIPDECEQAPCAICDLNGDGRVDEEDLIIMKRCLSQETPFMSADCEVADLNGDGRITDEDWEIFEHCYKQHTGQSHIGSHRSLAPLRK